jgi:ubiquinone/menaquinone biosynthesis C-methylase UbiE
MMQTDDIELQKIDQFVNLEGKRVLEIGCGDGRLTAFLADKGASVTAIDTDENRIETAKATVKAVDFRIGSGEALEFPKESFDLVFFSFSLHHQDGDAALAEARRVLRPEGGILIIEPTLASEYTRLVAVFQKEEPALLEKARRSIEKWEGAVARRETFVVPHAFETEEDFLTHYITSYGDGTASEKDRRDLRRIVGNKIFNTPISVEDECTIILISEKGATTA